MARKNRTPEENARREKIRELLQNSEIFEKFQKQKNHPNPKIQVVLCWSCWADSNRRPHPYQLIGNLQSAAAEGFPALFAPKG